MQYNIRLGNNRNDVFSSVLLKKTDAESLSRGPSEGYQWPGWKGLQNVRNHLAAIMWSYWLDKM